MRTLPILLASTLFSVSSSPAATGSCDPNGKAAKSVRGVADALIAADNDGDLGLVLGFYADDVVLMPPNEAPVIGRDAIRPRYQLLFDRFALAIEPHVEEVCVDGKLAFVRGRNGGKLMARDGGPTLDFDDVYLMVLRLEKDGQWRITRLMWHSAHPPAAAPSK